MMIRNAFDTFFGKKPQRISKGKTFIKKYNWKEINYPSGKDN